MVRSNLTRDYRPASLWKTAKRSEVGLRMRHIVIYFKICYGCQSKMDHYMELKPSDVLAIAIIEKKDMSLTRQFTSQPTTKENEFVRHPETEQC